MEPEKILTPHVTEDTVIDILSRVYGLEVLSIEEMVSYDDRNFHVKVSNNGNSHIPNICVDGYTFKITNKNANANYFDLLHSILTHLSGKNLRLPQPVPNLEGGTWSTQQMTVLSKDYKNRESIDLCALHLLTYLPGEPISSIEYTKDLLYQWGVLLAKFHNAAQDFSHDALDGVRRFWVLQHVPDIKKYMEGLDAGRIQLVQQVLKKYEEEIVPALPLLKKGILHGDFNDNNILVRQVNGRNLVDGILDLEDLHVGTYVWDVGLCLAYVTIRCEELNAIEGMESVLKGYLHLRTMSDQELSLLKTCIASRLCQSLVIGAYNARRQPENTYILDTATTGWSRLERVWNTPSETLLNKWKNARIKD